MGQKSSTHLLPLLKYLDARKVSRGEKVLKYLLDNARKIEQDHFIEMATELHTEGKNVLRWLL